MDDIIIREELPYSYAHYADTFIGFHPTLGAAVALCSCQKEAIENHLQMCTLSEEAQRRNQNPGWWASPYGAYPRCLLRTIERFNVDPVRCLLRFLRFEDGLCHRCNGRMPNGYYGFSDVPSGYFISHFRPYVNQACYKNGVSPSGQVVLPVKCPDVLKELDVKARLAAIENDVRDAFFFPRIGVNRNQESALFLIVRQILPESKVIQHFRTQWLGALELDIFVEQFNVGIEFQGVQHSEPMEHLGGEKALRATRKRDSRKAKLCKENGVKLLYVHEGDDLTDASVRKVLHQAIPSVSLLSPQTIAKPPFDFYITTNRHKTRWTYHHDKHELSVSGDLDGANIYMGSSDFDLTATVREGRVHSLRMWMHRFSGSLDVTLPITAGDSQEVECYRRQEPMPDFFRIWAMFEPNIGVRDEDEEPTGTSKSDVVCVV